VQTSCLHLGSVHTHLCSNVRLIFVDSPLVCILLVLHPLSSEPLRTLPLRETEIIGHLTAVAMRMVGPGPADLPLKILTPMP